jgi:hypothetical protein
VRVLCVCDEGNNRSVTIAQRLKYPGGGQPGHDTLSVGLNRNSRETVAMLCHWADRIIVTAADQVDRVPACAEKVLLWDIGEDRFPRPFNRELLEIVRGLMRERGQELAAS